jgi:hypothetical protein
MKEIQKTWVVKRYNEYVKMHMTKDGSYFIEGKSYIDNVYRLIKITKESANEYFNCG